MTKIHIEATSPQGTQVTFWIEKQNSMSEVDLAARDFLMQDLKLNEEEVQQYRLRILEDKDPHYQRLGKYSYRRQRHITWLPFGFYLPGFSYEILFEETPLRQWRGSESDIREIITLLNCAYDLGNAQGRNGLY